MVAPPPTVLCDLNEGANQWYFWCLWCGDWHHHGIGDGGAGHRIAHCRGDRWSPFQRAGYVLRPVGQVFERADSPADDAPLLIYLVSERDAILHRKQQRYGGGPLQIISAAELMRVAIPSRDPEIETLRSIARPIAERLGPDGMDRMFDRIHELYGALPLGGLERLWEGIHGCYP